MSDLSPYDAAERLQDLIIHGVLGGTMDQVKYKDLRRQLISDNHIATHVPQFIRDRRDLREVDQYLSRNFDNDADRKEFLWDTFRPLLEYLEFAGTPVQASTTELLKSIGMPGVHEAWRRALDRYVTDPAGAITSARTLLEEVCKHILADL